MLRRSAATACLVAIALAIGAVPGLHAVVHYLEDHAEAPSRRWRVEPSKRAAKRAPHGHDHGHGHRHHHHDGDERGGHGRGAPEHLGVAILEASPPALPGPFTHVDALAPASRALPFVTVARLHAHEIRGPPGRLLA